VAPFALDGFDAARDLGPAIATATAARTMPPFNVNNDGSCNTFVHARWLTEEQIDTIGRWVDAGMPAGDPELGMPDAPQPEALHGEQIVALKTPADYSPVAQGIEAAMYDDYQCFLLDPELAVDRFLTGFEVVPGNDRIVHHVLAFNVDAERNADAIAQLDAEDPRPGWDCYAAAGDGVWVEGVPVTWAPGTGATHFPEGTGIRIAAGQKLVVQMHYSLLEDDGQPDQTELRLAFADEVQREGHMALVDGFLLSLLQSPASLAPGQEAATFSWQMALQNVPNMTIDTTDVELMGILPHMHQRGRRMSVEIVRNDEPRCAADVDRWDFAWQQSFFYETPIPMTGSDELRVSCEWDTRADTDPVGPGFGTDAEMCLVGLYVAQR
jgi:hypothetical protein